MNAVDKIVPPIAGTEELPKGEVPGGIRDNLFEVIHAILEGKATNYVIIATIPGDIDSPQVHIGGGAWEACGLLDGAKARIKKFFP